MTLVRVAGAAESAALDAAAIAAGTPGRKLMRRAGTAAALRIIRHAGEQARRGVAIFAGGGNNGGDAWIVARELAKKGYNVRLRDAAAPTTDDARAARDDALASLRIEAPRGDEGVIVDGLLGTGSSGAPRGVVAEAIEEISARRERGAIVVSLDVPSGVDATSGAADGAVHADLTLSFATMKRGLLVARDHAGAIEVLDIGVHPPRDSKLPWLADGGLIERVVPALAAAAHKGTRLKLAVIGGARGMAGAVVLSGRAALRSGVGMVQLVVAPESLAAVQAALPEATATDWPASDDASPAWAPWADVLVVGPGIGAGARAMTELVLRATRQPVVLDADSLTAFSGDVGALAALLRGRTAVLTPHPAELARLLGSTTSEILVRRFDAGAELSATTGAIVLLKGTPTVCWAPNGSRYISASGNAALATAGSGDLLSGVVGTLVAQLPDALVATACAAWAHGRAAEIARGARRAIRGLVLTDVSRSLAAVWDERPPPLEDGVLAALPAAGERR